MKKFLVLLLVFSSLSAPLLAQKYEPTWDSVDKRPTPAVQRSPLRDLYSLGHIFSPRVCTRHPRQTRLRRVVLACNDKRQR